MTRLRFFRVLFPALLLPFLLLLALTMRDRPAPRIEAAPKGAFLGPRAEQIELTDLAGGSRRLSVKVRRIEQGAGGDLRLEGVERLSVDREGAPPLVLRAERGDVDGAQGQRRVRLEGGVRVQEEGEDAFLVSLPTLEVDESTGEARSIGEVLLEEGGHRGRAARVVYGLRGQPTEIHGLELSGPDAFSLSCESALLRDGTKDVEFLGVVRARRLEAALEAGTLRVERDASRRLRSANMSGGVTGSGEGLRVAARRASVDWDESGDPIRAELEGDALLERGGATLSAARIDANREGAEPHGFWRTHAVGAVRAAGIYGSGPAWFEAERLVAEWSLDGFLRKADLEGSPRFQGKGIAAEGARIAFESLSPGSGRVTLQSGEGRRARLAQDRSQVRAERIETGLDGQGFRAEGRVEATLLGAEGESGKPDREGMFRAGEAVHFVSSSLERTPDGRRLVFEGAVRGWQGERNLSADRVEILDSPEELHAQGNVATRLPRLAATVASDSDYVRITANRLDYVGTSERAVYEGNVRIRLAEGWLEAERVEVALATQAGGVREVLGVGKVRLEFRSADRSGMPEPVIGEGDRVVYAAAERSVRLIGEEHPAMLRRAGPEGGITTGRVLRYLLDAGTIEVESGERNRARIRGAEN